MLSQTVCNKVALKAKEVTLMQSKEVKKWQDAEALRRYQMIAPLLDESMDEGKRLQLREEIAEQNGISKRSGAII